MKKKERSLKKSMAFFSGGGIRIALAVIVILAVLTWQADLLIPKLEAGEEPDARPLAAAENLTDVSTVQLPVRRTFTGRVISRTRVERTPRIGGIVEQVLVDAGDPVKEGELLMRLDRELPTAHRDEARAALQQAQSTLQGTERLLERISRAVEADTLPETRLIEAGQARDAAAGAVKKAEAALRAAETRLGYTEIRSTADAVVIDTLLDEGDQAIPGRPALLLTDPSGLEVAVHVPVSIAHRLAAGTAVSCSIPALDNRLRGTVRTRQPEADFRTHTVEVKIAIDPPEKLVSGMFATAEIEDGTRSAVMVPEEAVQQIRQLDIVNVAGDDNRLNRRVVRTGQRRNGQVEILAGLSPGDRIAVVSAASTAPNPPAAP